MLQNLFWPDLRLEGTPCHPDFSSLPWPHLVPPPQGSASFWERCTTYLRLIHSSIKRLTRSKLHFLSLFKIEWGLVYWVEQPLVSALSAQSFTTPTDLHQGQPRLLGSTFTCDVCVNDNKLLNANHLLTTSCVFSSLQWHCSYPENMVWWQASKKGYHGHTEMQRQPLDSEGQNPPRQTKKTKNIYKKDVKDQYL